MKHYRNIIEKRDVRNHILYLAVLVCSLFSMLLTFFDFSRPQGGGYTLLFLLPLSYLFFLVGCKSNWNEIPQNIGLSVLFILQFIRLVITPAFLVFGGYHEIITYKASENTPLASILMLYETLWIMLAFKIKTKRRIPLVHGIKEKAFNQRMSFLMLTIVTITGLLCCFAPEILKSYRTIAGVFTEIDYTGMEQSYVVDAYATGFFSKFMLVSANYMLKVVRILLPAYLMVWLSVKFGKKARISAALLVVSPFLLVDGAIARSIYFTLFLLLTYDYLFHVNMKKLYMPTILAGIMVVVYFGARYMVARDTITLTDYISDKLIDYFAGLNIVAGSFNLPAGLFTRLHYFIGDILRAVPFANTLFGLDSGDTVQIFFNQCNMRAGGQIPTTLGMGAYYFGILFAPLYSFLFALLCKNYGRKYIYADNPYDRLVYLYISIICALGISMYNMEITLGTLVQVVFPIYIIARLAYPKIKKRKNL